MAIPALLSKKANAPVMMRITREDEHYIGRARPALHSRVKVGFRKDGRITALDGFVVVDNGPYDSVGDARSAGDHDLAVVSAEGDALARASTVLTNTPPRGAQRAPGGMQGNALMEPILAKAARKLGIDRSRSTGSTRRQARRRSARPTRAAQQNYVTSAFVKEALDKGAELFNWEEKKARSGKRVGTKVRGVGVARQRLLGRLDRLRRPARSSSRTAACSIQSGIGNLGTDSVIDVHRVAAEILGVAVGESARSSGATRRRTCRGPACRAAARRRTR